MSQAINLSTNMNSTPNGPSETIFNQCTIVSNSENDVVSNTEDEFQQFKDAGLIKLDKEDRIHVGMEKKFISSLKCFAEKIEVVAVHKTSHSGVMRQAKVQTFLVYLKAAKAKCNGNANVKLAWLACSKDEVASIISYGIDPSALDRNNGLLGRGVYLAADHSPIESAIYSDVDKNGLRHLLLCRVILGKAEFIRLGSEQSQPSSEEFTSGVDSLDSPRKYIVWSTQINTHIIPDYIVSFRATALRGNWMVSDTKPLKKPSSPSIPFPALLRCLSYYLPPSAMKSMTKSVKEHKEKKISRDEVVRRARLLAGDELLMSIIKSYDTRKHNSLGGYQHKKLLK